MAFRKLEAVLLGACFSLCALAGFAPLRAAPVQFLKVCGQGTFFIPGTDDCADANQIIANQFDVARQGSFAFTGIAVATALVEPFMPDHANFAVAIHEATSEHKFAIGLVARLGNSNFFVSGGFGTGLTNGAPTGQRAGFMFAW